ncbi:hypothetical protein DLD77_07455 [Chitinophaga alhagiae]|uniref:Uncharacterized protein n=1 Tax=Chitinophaga alhagiae TaxID=2203219 RepID=A0ABM6WCE4_9BACT|nr:hypothetical protein [Chitinophaga alhagiae]AWO01541.1 hypothetical protein DLD77_07455 [Chitinophaga alhagiae]
MRKLLITLIFLAGMLPAAVAQTDRWTGTWQMYSKPWPHIPAIVLELQIGAPEQGLLYPAQMRLQYGRFSGVYEVLLAKKDDMELGIGRGKYPIEETPFKLGIWMWYLNGTLRYNNGQLTLNRMWIDRFGIFMRGLYDDGDLWVNTKVMLRNFLYRDSISFKKINNTPWTHAHTRRIVKPDADKDSIYYGIYDCITAHNGTVQLQVEDQEKYDRDTVTLLQNGRPIFSRAEINDSNRRQTLQLDSGRNVLAFFADNYGGLPPNTGNLYMQIDGKEYSFDFRHRANAYATFLIADMFYQPTPGNNRPLTERAEGRSTTPVATIPVDTADVTLELWDGQMEDGDSISLRLNGEWIATGFAVKKRLQTIAVRLRPGENSLLFMADNLGSIPPNTAELRIRYGGKTKTLGLHTDMNRNNEIRLILAEP